MNDNVAGKSKILRGALILLWEEMKSINRTKLRGLRRILSGYSQVQKGKFKASFLRLKNHYRSKTQRGSYESGFYHR
jgi:hypothetical protein